MWTGPAVCIWVRPRQGAGQSRHGQGYRGSLLSVLQHPQRSAPAFCMSWETSSPARTPSSYEAALEHFSPDEDMKEATSQLKTLVDTLSPKAKDSVLELMVHGSLHTCCPCPWAAVSPTLGHACMLSRSVVSNSATPWTVARQAPLPMQFSKQEYWCCAVLSHSVMSNSL